MSLPTPPRYVVIPEEVIEQAFAPDKPRRALLASFLRILSLAWGAKYQHTPDLDELELMEFLKLSRRQYYEQKADMELMRWLRSSHPRPGFVRFSFSRSVSEKAAIEDASAENHTVSAENRTGELRIEEEESLKLLNTESSSPSPEEVRKTAPVRKTALCANPCETDENAQMVEKLIRHLPLLFDPTRYGLLDVRPEFLQTHQDDVLGWIAKAYQDRESLVKGGGPIGLIVARITDGQHANLYYVSHYLEILPEPYLEAVGLIEYECDYCEETFGTCAGKDAHTREKHPYICMECKAWFLTDEDEKAHYDKKHNPDIMRKDRPPRSVYATRVDGLSPAEKTWESVLDQLQVEMPRASFDTWVRDTRAICYDGNILSVGARNNYARDWLESRLTSTVNRMLIGILDANVSVQFVVSEVCSEQ